MPANFLALTGAPYPGLRPFEAAETHLFFGREQHVDALLARLHRSRLVAVVGESGAGKSSLVRAGLLPALEAGFLAEAGCDWRVALMRPGNSPLDALVDALLMPGVLSEAGGTPSRGIAAAELRRGPLGLVQLIRDARLPASTNVLLVVDQFEELFRFGTAAHRDEADAFVDLLLHSAAQRSVPFYLVLTMRSDFIGACARFRGLPEALNDNQYLTPRLTREQVGLAIRGPARVFGGDVEDALVATLENEVGDDADQLPLLQHLLLRLWQEACEQTSPPRITLAQYEALGGFQAALDQHAEQLYADLPSSQQHIAEALFRTLTGGDEGGRDLRRPALLADAAAAAGTDVATLAEVVEVFRAPGCHFLMPPLEVPLDAGTRLDISHESLIRQWQRLRRWVADEAMHAREFLGLCADAARWAAGGREPGELAAKNDLLRALAWRERRAANAAWATRYASAPNFALTMEFIAASEHEDQRQRAEKAAARRREIAMAAKLKRLSVVLGVVGVVAALVAVVAVRAEWDAVARRQEVEALNRVSEAKAAFFSGSGDALKKALDAVDAAPSNPEAVMALRRTVGAPLRVPLPEFPGPPPRAAQGVAPSRLVLGPLSFSPDGRQFVLPTADGTEIRMVDGTRRLTLSDGKDIVDIAAYSPDGGKIFTAGADGRARIWNAANGTLLHTLAHDGATVSSAAFDGTGRRLLTATRGHGPTGRGEVRLWDVDSGGRIATASIGYSDDDIRHAIFSADEQHILTLAGGGYVTVWDAASGRPPRELSFDRVVVDTGTAAHHRSSPCNDAVNAAIAYSPDGRTIAVLDSAGRATLFDAVTLARREPPQWQLPDRDRFCSLAWSHDASRLAAVTTGGQVRVWAANSGEPLRDFPRNADWSLTAAFDPVDRNTLLTAGSERGIALWHLDDEGVRQPTQVALLRGHGGIVHTAAASPDGHYLLSAADDDSVRLWKLPASDRSDQDDGQAAAIRVASSADSSDVAARTLRERAQRRVPAAAAERFAYPQEKCSPTAIANDGGQLALDCTDSPDGARWVSRYLSVKATRAAAPMQDWSTRHRIEVAAFDRRGTKLAIALDNRMLHVLNLQPNPEQGKKPPYPIAERRSEHDGELTDLQFNSDGTLLATSGRDGTVRVLDAATLRPLALVPLRGRPAAVAFDDGDRHILIAVGGEIIAWACPVCGTVDDLVTRGRASLAARQAASDAIAATGTIKTAAR